MSGKTEKVLHRFLSLAAVAALTISVNSCSFNRAGVAPDGALSAGNVGVAADSRGADGGCVPEECFGNASSLLKAGEEERARLLLASLADRYPETVWAARASFLLAGYALDEGSNEALGLIDDAASLTDIGDYIVFRKARALENSGLLEEAAKEYGSIAYLYPDSALSAEARFRMAECLKEAGDYKSARSAYESFIKDYPEGTLVPDAILNTVMTSLALDEPLEAAKAANSILVRYPAHPAAKTAEAVVSELKKTVQVPELTAEERFARAGSLFANARYSAASAEYAYLSKNAVEKTLRRSSEFKLALTEVRLKKYERAEKGFKDYLTHKDPEREREALYWLAFTAARQGKEDLLTDTEKRLASRFPGSRERARTLLFLANLYNGRGRKDLSGPLFMKVVKEFRGSDASDEALWSVSWGSYRQGRYEEALKGFRSYRELNPGGRRAGQFLYWSGRSLEKAGRPEEAASVYGRVCAFGSPYYCQMARGRLDSLNAGHVKAEWVPAASVEGPGAGPEGALPGAGSNDGKDGAVAEGLQNGADSAQGEPEVQNTEEDSSSGLELDHHYLAARELLIMGLNNLAARELKTLTSRYPDDPDALVRLAGLFYRSEDYAGALRVYYRYLSKVDPEERTDAAEELREYSFPSGLVESVRRKAPPGVDPCLVAAVMREESSFNPKAVSVTGALGLMQIMPSTGRFVAKNMGREGFETKDLLNPDTNITMGSWYLGYLGRKYDNDIVLTIAGYNAGPGAVNRWIGTLPEEFDEFIEAIPYTETRNYAKRVLESYGEFKRSSGAAAREGALRPDNLIKRGAPAALQDRDGGKS